MKKVSIVLPTYNGEKYIRESLDSILQQTYPNWELIVVDDCSTDHTREIVEAYCKKDARIRVIRNQENRKLPRSLNIGFRQAAGEYFTWTSDDNRFKPHAIEVMAGFLEANPQYGLVYCDMDFIDEDGCTVSSVSLNLDELYYDNCIGASFMYTRQAAQVTGEYNPDMFLVEDYEYWLRLNRYYPIYHLPKCVYEYRYHNQSLSKTRGWQIKQQHYQMRLNMIDSWLADIDDETKQILFLLMWSINKRKTWEMKGKFFLDGQLPYRLKWLKRIHKGENVMDNSKQIILFGAGDFGRKALEYFGKEKVHCFIDNNAANVGKEIEGVPIKSFQYLQAVAEEYQIVISVVAKTAIVLANQLEEAGIKDYALFIEIAGRITKGSLKDSLNYVEIFRRATGWMEEHTVHNKGIINHTKSNLPYPEVTGYYIPTLLRWGYREKAISYAKWLCSIQKEDGSWYDAWDRAPYVFDTAQVLKGLLAIRDICPDVDKHILCGCEWLLNNIREDGCMTTPDKSLWNPQECSDLIHLYCLEPLYSAANIFGKNEYKQAADRVKSYYLTNRMDEIMEFGLLSHFYAYVMEALCDIGETELAKKAMAKVFTLQKADGSVPAYKNVEWVCSTGLFQFALVWYKLGELEKGNRAFRYACSLQNPSGGWYGSYAVKENVSALDEKGYPAYAADQEISWAGKYFLDALSWKCKLEFEEQVDTFTNTLDKSDGRYRCVLEEVLKAGAGISVCDIGCGKGRYIRGLMEDAAGKELRFSCADISDIALSSIPDSVEKRQGTLTCIPYADETFDVVYTTEALEHAICIENGMRELVRVTKPGGKIIVVDKNSSGAGAMAIDEWEQWFDDSFFQRMADLLGCQLEVHENLSYDGGVQDGLFNGWVLKKA